MIHENKTCQNCKQQFPIEEEDCLFYQKIHVPQPTFCPECRSQRRLAFRNEWNLYRRKCSATGKDIISVYSPDKPFLVYGNDVWYGDSWDPLAFGRAYDFSRPFFEQFRDLQTEVPRLALINTKNINSEYTHFAAENKNCYLVVSSLSNENCLYGYRMFNSRDSLDCFDAQKCELCYEGAQLDGCYQSFFCDFGERLNDCWFCYDCRGCNHCFGSVGLRNKNYYWFNQPLSKDDYFKKFQELQKLPNWLTVARERFDTLLNTYPRRAARIIQSTNCSGDDIINSKNCKNCFHVKRVEDGRNILFTTNMKSFEGVSFDDDSELAYEMMSGQTNYNVTLSTQCWYSHDVLYSDACQNCSNLFGCVGLRNKHYCILNKQYTKEEYENRVAKIREHMNKTPYVDSQRRVYKYGEFFPIEFSPFGYNESVAADYFPLEKNKAIENGYPWNDYEAEPLQTEIYEVPDSIDAVGDDVLEKAIISEGSGKPFRILKQELEFCRKFNIPLPRITPFERHHRRLQKLPPIRMQQRTCEKCRAEVMTPYTVEKAARVYCEACYQSSVA